MTEDEKKRVVPQDPALTTPPPPVPTGAALATPSFMELRGSDRNAAMGLPPEIEQVGAQGFTLGPRSQSGIEIEASRNADMIRSLVEQARKPTIIETEHGGWEGAGWKDGRWDGGNVIRTPKNAPGSVSSAQAALGVLGQLNHGVTAAPGESANALANIGVAKMGAATGAQQAATDATFKGAYGRSLETTANAEQVAMDYYLNQQKEENKSSPPPALAPPPPAAQPSYMPSNRRKLRPSLRQDFSKYTDIERDPFLDFLTSGSYM